MSIYSDYGISSSSNTKASDLQAAITRQQYDDYQARFSPWLDTLTSEVSDANIAQSKRDWSNEITQDSQNAMNRGLAASGRNMSRFGIAESARTKQANKSLAEFSAGQNTVGNINNMNQSIDDRVMTLMSGQNLSG